MSRFSSASTRLSGLVLVVAALAAGCAASGAEVRPETEVRGDHVEIVTPVHGAEVRGPVAFTIDRGPVRVTDDTVDAGGQFWLVVDDGCVEVGEVLPVDEPGHMPVPNDTDTVEVDLTPGAHQVCLQFADARHVAYYEIDEITIRVTS
jgi:Domain of unknown function (DUF4399)